LKTLIDVPNRTWGKVKNFATVNNLSLNTAVDILLVQALADHGFPKMNFVNTVDPATMAR
jgi:hypothetical protein